MCGKVYHFGCSGRNPHIGWMQMGADYVILCGMKKSIKVSLFKKEGRRGNMRARRVPRAVVAAVSLVAACMARSVEAATLITTTREKAWQESEIEPGTAPEGAITLFETDGITPRAHSVPWRAWGTTFNELDFDALKMLTSAERDEILSRLFSPDGDMRFTRGRLSMNANDYSRAWYSCSEEEGDFTLEKFNIEHDKTNQIALVRMAQKFQPDLRFWMSPWSPPTWMKLNKDYPVLSDKTNNQPKEFDGLIYGGVVDENSDPNEMWLQGSRRKAFPRRIATTGLFIMEKEYLQAYADMFVKFIELYRAEGVPIDMVMYQNEAYSYTPYPGCAWTWEGTVTFNRDYLAPTLRAKCPGVRLYLGTFNTNRREYVRKIVEAPGMLDAIDGLGFQWEGREVLEAAAGEWPGKPRICSEAECGNGKMDWNAMEHTAWLILRNMGFGADEWYNWNFILADDGCSPWGWKQNALVRVDSKTKTFSLRPEYYAVKHFARYIAPGSVQLAYRPEAGHDGIEAIAYLNASGSVVVVAENLSGEDKQVAFSISGKKYSFVLKAHSINTVEAR